MVVEAVERCPGQEGYCLDQEGHCQRGRHNVHANIHHQHVDFQYRCWKKWYHDSYRCWEDDVGWY